MDITTLGIGITKHMFQSGDGIRVSMLIQQMLFTVTQRTHILKTHFIGEK